MKIVRTSTNILTWTNLQVSDLDGLAGDGGLGEDDGGGVGLKEVHLVLEVLALK